MTPPAGAPLLLQLAAERAEVQRLLEEYYKLDYEDYVGGIKTRFRCAVTLHCDCSWTPVVPSTPC
jgi:hypothetical protein